MRRSLEVHLPNSLSDQLKRRHLVSIWPRYQLEHRMSRQLMMQHPLVVGSTGSKGGIPFDQLHRTNLFKVREVGRDQTLFDTARVNKTKGKSTPILSEGHWDYRLLLPMGWHPESLVTGNYQAGAYNQSRAPALDQSLQQPMPPRPSVSSTEERAAITRE